MISKTAILLQTNNMKKNIKNRGFTLIELMVVIAIISLLSSIVLASIKTAREKAQITKAVGEMKSLQNAVELYMSSAGSYPIVGTSGGPKDDDMVVDNIGTDWGGFNSFLQTKFVANKYLANVVNSPNYPNNCKSDCDINGYIFGYLTPFTNPVLNSQLYFLCGGKRVTNYGIYFWANTKKINLPLLTQNGSSLFGTELNMAYDDVLTNPPYTYCIAM